MAEIPWWLAGDVPASPPLPWSGEVIPIEVPSVPVDVPIAGPVIHFIGEGEHAAWNDVWGWVKGQAKSVASDVVNLAEQAVAEAVKISEAYTGSVLQALSGFINDAFDYGTLIAQDAIAFGVNIADVLYADIVTLDADVYKILEDVVGIEGRLIPGLEAEIAKLGIDTFELVGAGIDAVKTWAIDNIYDPILRELLRVDTDIRNDVWALVGAVAGDIEGLIDAKVAALAATVAGLAAAVAALTIESEECVQEMCATQGPNTDLGKLLKGLSLALDAAAIADLLSLTEPELVQRLTDTISEFGRFVSDIEANFLTGGRTLGATLAGLA